MYGFVDVERHLWREVESVVFSCCWASPAQSFSGLSSAGLMGICYCLNFLDFLNLEGLVPLFLSPRNRVAQLYLQTLVLSPKSCLASWSRSSITADGQSASLSWCRAPIWRPSSDFLHGWVGVSQPVCLDVLMSSPFWFSYTGERSSSRYIATDDQSASLSWCRAPCGAGDQMLDFFEWQLLSFFIM
jgi:hypothetical protein